MITSAPVIRASTTTVVVVDDHRTFSDLLALALTAEPDFDCVGKATSVATALAMVEDLRPDLVLMDVRLGDGDGVAATAELTRSYPDLRVVVLTAHADLALMKRAADAGACCLLPKDGSLPDMLEALRRSRRGGITMPQLPTLTRREHDVLMKLAIGLDARAIAKHLGISVNTCRGYVKSLMLKLGAHSQLEAVVIATNNGLVRLGPHR